jgi:hypothetical protein
MRVTSLFCLLLARLFLFYILIEKNIYFLFPRLRLFFPKILFLCIGFGVAVAAESTV